MNRTMAILLLALLTGCASVTGSKIQPVSVQTILGNKEIAGVGCTLTNDAGKWFVTTPGSVTVQKSTGDMAVDCNKDGATGHENVVSKSNGAVWGNIILGGGVGYIVDRNTGAGFDYPATITVQLNGLISKAGESLGITLAEMPKSRTVQADTSSLTNTASEDPTALARASADMKSAKSDAAGSLSQKLHDLQKLHNDGLINDDEFAKKKMELLGRL